MPRRRALRGDQRGQLAVAGDGRAGAVGALAVAAERDLIVGVDLAVVEREQDVGAVEQRFLLQRRQHVAERGVVFFDDLDDGVTVGAVRRGGVVVDGDEVPDEHIVRHGDGRRRRADERGGVAQREGQVGLTRGRRPVQVVAGDHRLRVVQDVGQEAHRERRGNLCRAEGGADDRQVNLVGAGLEWRQLPEVRGAAARALYGVVHAVATREQRVAAVIGVVADGDAGQVDGRRKVLRA